MVFFIVMNNRFIKLYESILEWQHFKQSNYLQVFLSLIFRANYKDGFDRQGRKIHIGQAVISQREFAEECGVSRNTLISVLNGLVSSGEITINNDRNYTLITIKNYKKWQKDQGEEIAVGSVSGSKIEPKDEPKVEPLAIPKNEPQVEPKDEPIQEVNKDRKIEYNNNSLSIIRATEFENFLDGQNSLWFENTKVALREPSEEKIRQLIKRFSAEMIARDEQAKTENDLKKHFVSWCKIEIDKEKKEEQRKSVGFQQTKTATSNSPEKFAKNISQKDFSKGFEKF